MFGKHGLGAAGEFVRERFRDRCPKIIARLIEDAPGQIQRTITGGPFKFSDWRVNFLFHASNSISRRGTKAVQARCFRGAMAASERRKKIAHGASRGVVDKREQAPSGAKENFRIGFAAPTGAWMIFVNLNPRLKPWATIGRCSAAFIMRSLVMPKPQRRRIPRF